MRTVHSWADAATLSCEAPLPLDRPFTGRDATSWGVPSQLLTRLVTSGHVRRLLRGVYVASQVPDSL
ncbi:MAG: type IV toxin-antitoxin system AbiEi family antitoxin domain-containing protein, partial [Nocardioides sp.]|nr:type IV toxin-antitoxin system AbiEi family antitoxin domain-containing protein [Nocardioides sp.]